MRPFPNFTSWNLAGTGPGFGDDGWLVEVKANGQFLCQHGIAMDDVKKFDV